jgi:peptide-methionine (S)-S-oxide reductase
VSSGSLDAVRVLVEAGADVARQDLAWGGTPLGWAEHYLDEATQDNPGKHYAEIAAYLRGRAVNRPSTPR